MSRNYDTFHSFILSAQTWIRPVGQEVSREAAGSPSPPPQLQNPSSPPPKLDIMYDQWLMGGEGGGGGELPASSLVSRQQPS